MTSTPTRQRLVAVSLALLFVLPSAGMLAGVAAGATTPDGVDDGFGGGTIKATTAWGGVTYSSDVPAWTMSYDGRPGWFVTISDGSDLATLEDWAGAGEDRDILQINDDSNRVLVAAPASHIGTSLIDRTLNNGLASQEYVEHITLVQQVGTPDPPDLSANRSEFSAPVPGSLISGSWDQSNVAWPNSMEASTMQEARAAMGADADDRPTGDSITVAVLDTGVNTANGRVFGNGSSGSALRITASKNFVSGETGLSAVEDGNGHGTWVASAIAANTSDAAYEGVAPDAELVIGKVLSDDGDGSIASITQAVEWASENQSADVISMSLGSNQYSPALASELKEAIEETDVSAIVVAAGNSRQTVRYLSTPADVTGEDPQADGLITVAATNVSQPDEAASTYFSSVGPDGGIRDLSQGASRGALPTVAAPGAKIEAATPSTSGSVDYSTLSGTSMATPLVSGSIASLLDGKSSLVGNPGDLEQHLAGTTSTMPKAGYTEVGAGMVNLSEALATSDAASASSYYERQKTARDEDATARDEGNSALSGWSRYQRILGESLQFDIELPL